MSKTDRRANWWSSRRPSVRIVVSDADAAICGAVAHLVGVSFRTPVVAHALNTRVRVEVLGDYRLDSSLMAAAMGEPFAAEPLADYVDPDGVLAVVTVTGLSAIAHERAFIEATGAPIVCLGRLGGEVVPDAAPPALTQVACPPYEAFNDFDVPELSIADIADRCFAFTTIVANELAG
jgi:hypothetical protein